MTTASQTEVLAALEQFKPELAASFSRLVTRLFEQAVAAHGDALKGVYNGPHAKAYRETVARFTKRAGDKLSDPVSLDAERLAKGAALYADATVETWAGKIVQKAGELSDPDVKALNGCTFQIRGRRGEDTVVIDQTMIVNVSSKGTLFNQFPARIYVNGKFTSEASYRKGAV